MARKVKDLSPRDIEKILDYEPTDHKKLAQLVGELIKKAHQEGWDEGYENGRRIARSSR